MRKGNDKSGAGFKVQKNRLKAKIVLKFVFIL